MKEIKNMHQFDELKLSQSFQEACQDKEFKEYVYKLNIKEEVLMKYTSQLQESYQEKKNCSECESLETCKNELKGFCCTAMKDKNMIRFFYDECKKSIKEEKQNQYKKYLHLYDMPKGLEDASFKNIYKDDKGRVPIIKYFKDFIEKYEKKENPKGLYLNGSFGSGKTYLISALFNEMAKKGVQSIQVYYPELLRGLKASFQTDYEERFQKIKTVPLLLLDDIGAENSSNWARDEILGPILQYRMENHLPTFFTSNLTLEELENSLSFTQSGVDKVKARRIIERMKQLAISIELISKNRRD